MDKLQQILQIIVVLCILLCTCYIIGKLVDKKWTIASNASFMLRIICICIVGWLVELAIFQVLSVPMIIRNMPFSTLVKAYVLCIGAICLAALGICKKELLLRKEFNRNLFANLPKLSKYKIAAFSLIALQCFLCLVLRQVYEDGIFDYSLAAHTLNHNTMFRTYAYTGYDCSLVFYADRFINGWYMYRTFLAKIMSFQPTMVGQTILPPILLLLSYISYYLLGRNLIPEEEKLDIYMIFFSIINIFGFLRLTPMVMLLTQTVNGKSVFANFLLPLMFLSILKLYDNTEDQKQFLFLTLLNICSAAMTTTAVVYSVFITLLLLGIVAFIKKKINVFLLSFLTVIPNGIYIILYILEREWGLWV